MLRSLSKSISWAFDISIDGIFLTNFLWPSCSDLQVIRPGLENYLIGDIEWVICCISSGASSIAMTGAYSSSHSCSACSASSIIFSILGGLCWYRGIEKSPNVIRLAGVAIVTGDMEGWAGCFKQLFVDLVDVTSYWDYVDLLRSGLGPTNMLFLRSFKSWY